MISVISRPDNLTAAFLPVAYAVESSDSSNSFDVEIYDENFDEILGIKRYLGDDVYSVELGDYLRYRFDIQPIGSPLCALFADESKLKGVGVKVDGIFEDEPSWHTFATENVADLGLMSDAPNQREISWAQRDEISLLVSDAQISACYTFKGESDEYILELDGLTVENKVVSLVTDMRELMAILLENQQVPSAFSSLKLEVFADDEAIAEINYQLKEDQESEYRLCWLNKYGALDYFSFAGNVCGYCEVTKQRVYSASGYKVTGSSMSRMMNLFTDFLPNSTLEWLSGLLASPRVWLVEGDEFELMDVISDSLIYQDEDLLRLELSVRNAQSQEYQYY